MGFDPWGLCSADFWIMHNSEFNPGAFPFKTPYQPCKALCCPMTIIAITPKQLYFCISTENLDLRKQG